MSEGVREEEQDMKRSPIYTQRKKIITIIMELHLQARWDVGVIALEYEVPFERSLGSIKYEDN